MWFSPFVSAVHRKAMFPTAQVFLSKTYNPLDRSADC